MNTNDSNIQIKKNNHHSPLNPDHIINMIPGNFYYKDRLGVYQHCNKALLELLGIKKLIGKTDEELWPNDAQTLKQNDDIVITQQKTITAEEAFTLKNGQKKIFLSIKAPWKDENNNIIGVIANLTDVTEFKQREAALKETQAKIVQEKNAITTNLENIVICAPGSIYWKNSKGVYLGCNDFMVKEAGLQSRSDIIGKTDEELWPEQAKKITLNDLEVMQSGKAVSIEETVVDNVYFSMKMPLRDDVGNICGVVCNSHNITYLKKIESELREATVRSEAANRAKSDFLAVISHELRIPLTSILGMTQLLSTKNLTLSKQQEYLHHILTAGMHLLNLINDTLDFAKLEADKFELALAPMDLKALIEEVFTMLTPLAKAKKLELLIHFETTSPHLILGDKRVLRQIIINLVGNAIKFTERGYVSIQVEAIEQTSHSAKLVISIIDTGIGIPEEKQGMIFDHFSQVDASQSRRYGGAGLGLTITKQLVELMSGTISVSSQVAKGTTFRCVIEFPLQKEAITKYPWMAYESSVRILIVDDTPRGNVIQRQLSPSNSQVVSSQEAFSTLLASYQLSDPYDVVIIDQRLKNIDPYELSQSIRQHQELYQPMLVILIDNGSVNTKEAAKAAGFFECLTKPIQPFALQVALTAAWENWIEQREMRSLPVFMPPSQPETTPIVLPNSDNNVNKIKVLLVEDDAIVQIVHLNYLQELNCHVEIANNGKEALEKLKGKYDLVFLDMGLPDIHGMDVIKEYRKRTLGKNKTPIVSLTGYSAESSKQDFLKAGVEEVMIKPVFLEQLKKVIQKYCKEKIN